MRLQVDIGAREAGSWLVAVRARQTDNCTMHYKPLMRK